MIQSILMYHSVIKALKIAGLSFPCKTKQIYYFFDVKSIRTKVLISAKAKMSPIKDGLNYLNNIATIVYS